MYRRNNLFILPRVCPSVRHRNGLRKGCTSRYYRPSEVYYTTLIIHFKLGTAPREYNNSRTGLTTAKQRRSSVVGWFDRPVSGADSLNWESCELDAKWTDFTASKWSDRWLRLLAPGSGAGWPLVSMRCLPRVFFAIMLFIAQRAATERRHSPHTRLASSVTEWANSLMLMSIDW